MKARLLASVLALGFMFGAQAAPKTVTLSVPDMSCASCPVTVKKALSRVPGVTKTEVNLDRREARVTFDDARTNVQALTKATEDAGYPAKVVASN
jgi:mercuric transport protein periplasmic component